MAISAETILSRPIPDVFAAIRRPVEVSDEPAATEAVRLALVAHGLLKSDQTLTPLPEGDDYRKHENSQGRYFLEQEIDSSHVVYGYGLEARQETSYHPHPRGKSAERPDIYESIICVQGKIMVRIGNTERVLKEGEVAFILPENWHSVRAVTDSVVAAFSQNGAKWPRDKRHGLE